MIISCTNCTSYEKSNLKRFVVQCTERRIKNSSIRPAVSLELRHLTEGQTHTEIAGQKRLKHLLFDRAYLWRFLDHGRDHPDYHACGLWIKLAITLHETPYCNEPGKVTSIHCSYSVSYLPRFLDFKWVLPDISKPALKTSATYMYYLANFWTVQREITVTPIGATWVIFYLGIPTL